MTDAEIPPMQDFVDFERETERELKGPPRFPLVKFDDVALTTTSFYRVKGLLPAYGLVVIWGSPKCGKSFWAFDLLMHIALGWEYRGLRVKAGPIVYCALEGKKGFSRRLEAFRRENPGSEGAQFYLMFLSLDLIRDHKSLIESIRAQLAEGVQPAAVAVDTLNRSLVGSESNDEDMAAYVRAADAISDAFGCVVPVVHHCGHNGDRPRGHSSLLGAADAQIAVKRDAANNIVATVEASKDGALGLEIVSRLAVVDLGPDEDGDEMTSCVIEPVGELAATVAKDTPRLTKGAKIALRALHEAMGDLGEVPPASNHIPPNVRAVTIDQWRSYAYRLGISGSPEARARQVAFQRAHEVLIASKQAAEWDPYAWIVRGEQNGRTNEHF
jgi:AAA domain